MTVKEQVRYRIDKKLVKESAKVCESLGMTPAQAISMFLAQLIRLRALPFRPSEFPALEAYGVTLAEAEAAENSAIREIRAERKAGRLVEFKGKLPV
jgi:addiction module RelB/DinJ family antitoxin